MLIMLFVNDLAGVKGIPPWMEHIQPSDSDGMTFVDLVFPAFLFIVGVSIPFALGSRLERGVPSIDVWKHILTRTIGLLIMGFFMVNGETISRNSPLPPELWGLLTYVAMVLIWLTSPGNFGNKRATMVARGLGVALLVTTALLYRGNDATGWFQLRPQWWGILGLIGWAYLGACIVYMFCYRNLASIIGAISLIYCVAIADAMGGFRGLSGPSWLASWVSIGTVFGSQTAITVSGMALGMILTRDSTLTTHSARIRWAFLYGLALGTAGILLHTAHGLATVFHYNKNAATVPWCLVSSAVTVWLWIAVYIASDIRRTAATVLVPVGQNALTAYILAPLVYSLMDVLHVAGIPHFYNMLGNSFALGFWRSVAFAVGIAWIAGVLERRGIRLKL
jgi:predicted acyltransferase